MKKIFLFCIMVSLGFGAILENVNSFEADFSQTINDKENKVVVYYGHVIAKKPQLAKWHYTKPIQKTVYIDNHSVVVLEPELEQAIIRKIKDDFNIFDLLQNATKIAKNKYQAKYKETVFTIVYDGKNITKLTYNDNFDNLVTIKFSNQHYNKTYEKSIFDPKIPHDFDMIVE